MKTGFVTAVAAVLLLLAPWLVPPQGSPSPSIPPWLFSVACTGILLAILPALQPRRLAWIATALAALILMRSPGPEALAACLALGIIVGAAIIARASDERVVTWVATAWLMAALLSAIIGLCQYFGVEQYFAFMSPSANGDAFANLRQRNQFATLTNIGLAALIWLDANQGGPQGLKRVGVPLAGALLALGNAASSSRTGLLGLLLIVGLDIYWGAWQKIALRRLLWSVVLSYVLAALVLPDLAGHAPGTSGILARFRDAGPACASRLTMWRDVLELTALRPWLGWGWGELDYAHFITPLASTRHCELVDNAHNLGLQLAVELGIPAAMLICGGLCWLIARGRPWREEDDTRRMAWAVVAMILLHSLLEYPLWYGPFQMALGLAVGLLGSAGAPQATSRATSRPMPTPPLAARPLGSASGRGGIHRVGLPPRQSDLPESGAAHATLPRRYLRQDWRLMAVWQAAAFCAIHTHAADARQCAIP